MGEPVNVTDIRSDDIVIGFMGPTGSGKSCIIDLLTGQTGQRSGSALGPITNQVEATRVRHPKYEDRIVLVDFPSFYVTDRTDLEILEIISDWLRIAYERNVKLSGIIYLHRITDCHMAGSPLVNLEMFGVLCGNVAMSRVLIVSTMWEVLRSKRVGTSSEGELRDKPWSPFIKAGAGIERLERADTKEAWRIIGFFLGAAHEGGALLIQEELVDLERSLRETMAGKTLHGKLQKHLVDQSKSMKSLLAHHTRAIDGRLAEELKEEYDRIEQNFERMCDEVKRLKITYARQVMISTFGKEARVKPVFLEWDKDTTQTRFLDIMISRVRWPKVRLLGRDKSSDTDQGDLGAQAPESQLLDSKGPNPDPSDLLETFSLVLETPEKRKALQGLTGPDAQLMIDYIHSILLQPELPIAWLRKHSRIALYRLCSASTLYPQCCVLKGIVKPDVAEASGGSGDVYKAHHGDRLLCLKVVRLRRKSELELALKLCAKEGMILAELRHPNILPFYGIYYLDEKREQVCLVSPWMNRGDLVTYIRSDPSVPRVPFIHDISSGLEYLHSEGVVHGDIKGANVLVNDSGRACIADFGLASIPVDQTLAYSRGVTTVGGCSYRWTAPELLGDGAHTTRASDVWAFGCLCYEVLIGKAPFDDCTKDAQIMRNLMIGTSPIGSVRPPQIESDMWALMEHCCTFDPTGRPEFPVILEMLKGSPVVDPGHVPIETLPEGQQFLNEMREGKGAVVDLRRVQQVFNKIQLN